MGGGPKKPAMPADERDFDILFIGGGNAAAITKQMQVEPAADHWKMAIVSE